MSMLFLSPAQANPTVWNAGMDALLQQVHQAEAAAGATDQEVHYPNAHLEPPNPPIPVSTCVYEDCLRPGPNKA
jgi:hypothetical protein